MNPDQMRIVDEVTTQFILGYKLPGNLAGRYIFPTVYTTPFETRAVTFDDDAFIIPESRTQPGTKIREVELNYGFGRIDTVMHSLLTKVPIQAVTRFPILPDIRTKAASRAMSYIVRRIEKTQAEVALDSANYNPSNVKTLGAGEKFDDITSDPLGIIGDGRQAIRRSIGMYPNVLLFSADSFEAVKRHPKITSLTTYTGLAVTQELLAEIFTIDKVYVGESIEKLDGTMRDIWGANAVLAFVPEPPVGDEHDKESPSYGYTYEIESSLMVSEMWFDYTCNSWRSSVNKEAGPILTGPGAGYLIKDTLT